MKEFFKRSITAFILGALFWLSFIYLPPVFFSGILLLILAQIIIYEWTRIFNIRGLTFWLLMPFYPILPFVLMIIMNQNPMYHSLLLVLFILVSSHDTGSYVVGNLIGKYPIASWISPRKTWEGFFGGWTFASIGLYWVLWEFDALIPVWEIIGFSFIICALSLLGDLFESWLKRRARIKDSGMILPGHGGFLDRFDGIMLTAFFFYIFKDQLIHLFKL